MDQETFDIPEKSCSISSKAVLNCKECLHNASRGKRQIEVPKANTKNRPVTRKKSSYETKGNFNEAK